MSQKKVDAYKQEKENRKKLVAKQKRQKRLAKIAAIVICAALAVWVIFSVVHTFLPAGNGGTASADSNFDSNELQSLLNELNAATDTDAK